MYTMNVPTLLPEHCQVTALIIYARDNPTSITELFSIENANRLFDEYQLH